MKLYNAIERLEEIALAYGNELKSIQAAFPKLQIDMQQALAVRTAELNAEGRMLSSQEIVRQCAAMRGELEAIVGRHFSAVIAERQRMIELTEIKGALTEIAAGAATDAVKAYAADESTGVSTIVRRELAALPNMPTSAAPAAPNWADVFKGNWTAETTYQRGDIFTFRGGCYLVLQTALGLMPSKQNQTGPDAHYGILSAPGAPGVNQPFTSPVMVGSTSGAAGAAGLVPTPAAGTQTKFLRGDGTFVAISGGGDMLAANNLGDVLSVSSARTNLGLGVANSPAFASITLSASIIVDAATAVPSIQVRNIGTDEPIVGFYRGGTLRSVLQLKTDDDFRLYSSDLATYANLKLATLTASAGITSNSATSGVGYSTGAGGAVTQITSRTTGVTLNKVCGAITLVSAAGSTSFQTFTVTNSAVAATDCVVVHQKSGTDLYEIHVTAIGAGTFNISFKTTGGTTTEQPVFNFSVVKAVAA